MNTVQAEFAIGGVRRVDGEWAIYPNSLLFKAGAYPSKQFEMTAAEMANAVDKFKPIGGNIEHTDFLKGRACEVRSIRLDDAEPSTLRGEVAVPLWLDDNLEARERKLSCEWSRDTKTLEGIGLVVHPHVSDAALMAAFAQHSTPEGASTLQRIHDESARGGAVCKASNTAKMASAHEASAIQNVHDMTTEHGATCSSKKPGQPNGWPYFSTRKEGTMTNAWDWLKAKLEGEPAPDGSSPTVVLSSAPPAPAAPAPATMSADDPQLVKLRDEAALNAAEVRKLRLERIADQAVVFADTQIREKRAFPAEKEAIVADFMQRATDDTTLGVVTFGEGDAQTKTTRVELLKALFAAKQPHALTTELLDTNGLVVLSNRATTDTKDKPASADRVKELLNMTELGRAQNGAH